jgi:5-methylcytosine-specific restriction endonuclease McrA
MTRRKGESNAEYSKRHREYRKTADRTAESRRRRQLHHDKIMADLYEWRSRNFRLDTVKTRAEAKGIPFDPAIRADLTPVPELCPHCGVTLTTGRMLTSREIDRDVPELGYVPGNVSWMCKRCNRSKSVMTIAQWKAGCHVRYVVVEAA